MTKHSRLGFLAVVPALLLALPLQSFAHPRQLEAIDRGLLVSNVGKSGMLVSWRLLGTEDPETEFNLYRHHREHCGYQLPGFCRQGYVQVYGGCRSRRQGRREEGSLVRHGFDGGVQRTHLPV